MAYSLPFAFTVAFRPACSLARLVHLLTWFSLLALFCSLLVRLLAYLFPPRVSCWLARVLDLGRLARSHVCFFLLPAYFSHFRGEIPHALSGGAPRLSVRPPGTERSRVRAELCGPRALVPPFGSHHVSFVETCEGVIFSFWTPPIGYRPPVDFCREQTAAEATAFYCWPAVARAATSFFVLVISRVLVAVMFVNRHGQFSDYASQTCPHRRQIIV